MVEVDRLMIVRYGIQLKQMMENAGRHLARLAVTRFLTSSNGRKRVAVLSGSGGNGGGSMVCARHLSNWGVSVHVFLAKASSEFSGVPADQLAVLRKMGVPVYEVDQLPDTSFDLVIDGIIGYSLRGQPRDGAARIIRWCNAQSAPVLALDIPSGIDSTTGQVINPAIKATVTMTLALPKKGLLGGSSRDRIGELYLADISVPPQLYHETFGMNVDAIFQTSEIVRLRMI